MRIRKSYSPDFKAKVVLELLREEKIITQLASEHGIHPTLLNKWRQVTGLPMLFADEQRAIEKLKTEHDREKQQLYAEIGRMTTEASWLKKNWLLT
ncbi:MAG: transposase [Peptococcaceae bacterium]|nr:transposase [Peptococcaceae bacterium]